MGKKDVCRGGEAPAAQPRLLALATFVVREYDEAIAYFVDVLGFRLIEDRPVGEAKRWVVVSPGGPAGAGLLLARAATPEQVAVIGRQTGGRVFLFLQTADFERDYQELAARGVRFREAPRHEPYGRVAVFEDLYGNAWDLLELTGPSDAVGR